MNKASLLGLAGSLLALFLFLALIMAWGNGIVLVVGLLAAVGVCLAGVLVRLVRQAVSKPSRRLYAKDFSLKFLSAAMGLCLVAGTLLYIYAFHIISLTPVNTCAGETYPLFNNGEYFLRSLICSLDLFMLDVDSSILDRLDGQPLLKAAIAIQAVLSFSCTIAVLVSLVYYRLREYIRLAYRTRITPAKNHLYLFFGNNTPSELLMADIIKNDPKAVAVIIDEANVKDDDSNEWDNIVGLMTHKRRIFDVARFSGAHVGIASQQLVDIDREISDREDFDAFGYLGLRSVRRLIEGLGKHPGSELHVFFMDDDEDRNIRNIMTLAKDKTIKAVALEPEISHRIYCHARFNGPNRVIQDVALRNKLNIRIVDSSHIAVELLKQDVKYHPVNVVSLSPDNPTTVDKPFSSLIIGFGEVGRDAFRFLYEFGAFVDSASTDTRAARSPFVCTVVDSKLDSLQGTFRSLMPGIFSPSAADGNVAVSFRATDFNSVEFNDEVLSDENLRELNYVVISIGDNDESIALAARIFTRARRLRPGLGNLKILVRCTDDAKFERMQRIADHYNQGYGLGAENPAVIEIFGQPEKTYTFSLVVKNRFEEMARDFYENYRRQSGEGASWNARRVKLTDTGLPDLDKLRKLRRQESQDLANAFHGATKMFLLRRALGPDTDWTMFRLRYFKPDGEADFTGSRGSIRYPRLSDAENRIILRLAMLEHIRWNAAHELMGYRVNPDGDCCDERTMQHNCLCSWQELDAAGPYDYKRYDFCVVDTTLARALLPDYSDPLD